VFYKSALFDKLFKPLNIFEGDLYGDLTLLCRVLKLFLDSIPAKIDEDF